jgi:phospholipid/cholesterol/gamma-HCH transport system ATP-binding protein
MNPNPTPIIQVEKLTAAYDGQVVFQDVSFTVNTGEVFVILGVAQAYDRFVSPGGR